MPRRRRRRRRAVNAKWADLPPAAEDASKSRNEEEVRVNLKVTGMETMRDKWGSSRTRWADVCHRDNSVIYRRGSHTVARVPTAGT